MFYECQNACLLDHSFFSSAWLCYELFENQALELLRSFALYSDIMIINTMMCDNGVLSLSEVVLLYKEICRFDETTH